MRYLLDSHIALWAMSTHEKLSEELRERLSSGDSSLYVSAASIWELRLKEAKGKLKLPDAFENYLTEESIQELPVTWAHARKANELPPIHADPFDRILIAQAALEDLTLVTQDKRIREYPIATTA